MNIIQLVSPKSHHSLFTNGTGGKGLTFCIKNNTHWKLVEFDQSIS